MILTVKMKKMAAFLMAMMVAAAPLSVSAAEDPVVGTLTMDTSSYTLPPKGIYDFKATISGDGLKQENVEVYSSRSGIAKVERVAGTGKYRITGLTDGVTYITAEYAGVHASIKVTVQNGAKPSGITNWTVSQIHASDTASTVNVTFPEGTNLMGVAALLEKNRVCSASEVLEAAKGNLFDSYDFIAAITNPTSRYYKLEGYLFPDTYNFYRGDSAKNALKRMLDAMQTKMDNLKTQAAAAGMSVDQLLTLASLIQAEAANAADMYQVSSVLHNRLNNGAANGTPKLQCDSTSFYPYRTKTEAPAGFDSTYDTYTITGLPAGPICNPGMTAIDAALHPTATSYYYFCHSKDGTAYYAATYEEHQQNLILAGLQPAQ